MSLSRLMRQQLDEVLAVEGITAAQFGLLMVLHHHEERLTAAQVARILGKDRPTTGGLVKRMEGAGWIEQVPAPEDRRARHLLLTKQAVDRLNTLMALADRVEGAFLIKLPEEDQVALGRILDQLLEEDAHV